VKSQRNTKHKYTMTGSNALAPPTPPIQRRLEELHSQISTNGEVLENLSRRLEFITASVPELPDEEVKDMCNCTLEAELNRATVRLREQQQRMSYLLRNIQL
jgi:hypothetical protein